MEKDPNKGHIALLGWSLNVIEPAQNFDRRYVVVAPGDYFKGDGAHTLRDLLKHQEDLDVYV